MAFGCINIFFERNYRVRDVNPKGVIRDHVLPLSWRSVATFQPGPLGQRPFLEKKQMEYFLCQRSFH